MSNLTKTDKILIEKLSNKINREKDYLDFLNSNTKYLTHGYHIYPAMMIPQLAKEFIELVKEVKPEIKKLYDPFMGSGTSLVEGLVHDLEVYGTDINPLSQMMSKAKTTPIEPSKLSRAISDLEYSIREMTILHHEGNYKISNLPDFDKIDFWFKKEVIISLQLIKNCINDFMDDDLKTFFMASFSETVRHVSNTRNNEFKLYRMAPEKLENWSPNVNDEFLKRVYRNEIGNMDFYKQLEEVGNYSPKTVINKQSNIKLPDEFKNEMFDIVVTSPPYGDSKTTVAYGQFSRLSAQWLDLKIDDDTKINQLDNVMLGGRTDRKIIVNDVLDHLDSPTLNTVFNLIKHKDEKRALEVLQFYIDLDKSIKETTRVMKPESYQFWVVANRTVKMISIPTDIIISELFRKYNVHHLYSFYRKIPNKRMPSKNSPTNKIGNHSVTMTSEIILMLKKDY
ncbi:DNA methylase [Macrococcus brunensis]|uniref:site-specific DNA-methyltransferase (cytosine-N(4)-specific) n=1 Tax=Macrococcus brunensis TaxID=198483 RepID=A0A4R6BAP7_9STAP|nr:DNA methylase [Macrococcus brunensis]TDL93346.1 DNA methylase [Macrococcus brunensis]